MNRSLRVKVPDFQEKLSKFLTHPWPTKIPELSLASLPTGHRTNSRNFLYFSGTMPIILHYSEYFLTFLTKFIEIPFNWLNLFCLVSYQKTNITKNYSYEIPKTTLKVNIGSIKKKNHILITSQQTRQFQ